MTTLLKLWRPLCYLQFFSLLAIYTLLGLTPNPGSMVPMYSDWLMHFTGYVVAGISISFTWPQWHWRYRAMFVVVFSIFIEIGQHFMPPRTFSVTDILANGSGVLTGIGLFYVLRRIAPRPLLRFFSSTPLL